MAKRYSGNATVQVTYDDRDYYPCQVVINHREVWRGAVGVPACGFGSGIAYDSPEAYDSAARAAFAFAECEAPGLELDYSNAEIVVSRTRP